jgi:hypothetical protein
MVSTDPRLTKPYSALLQQCRSTVNPLLSSSQNRSDRWLQTPIRRGPRGMTVGHLAGPRGTTHAQPAGMPPFTDAQNPPGTCMDMKLNLFLKITANTLCKPICFPTPSSMKSNTK